MTTGCCVMTGANGYVGSRLKEYLEKRDIAVRQLVRNVTPGRNAHPFELGDVPPPSFLADADTLIHCAYDRVPVRWADIRRINVEGAIRLFRAASNAGVQRIILISSISAFKGCASRYGAAKLLLEEEVAKLGGISIRPGLVYGERPGGMVGSLTRAIKSAHFIPLVAGAAKVHLCHEADLCTLVHHLTDLKPTATQDPIIAASPQVWRFRDLLRKLARDQGRSPLLVPVPWPLVWIGLKCSETLGLRIGFASDSLTSLTHPNPNLQFKPTAESGVTFRDL